jgi:PleD family two-component response regulator
VGPVVAEATDQTKALILAFSASHPELQQVSASFGIALFEPEHSWSVTLARTDAALYRAKYEGRNRVSLAEPAVPT